jgi:hypothetical protein
MKELMSQNAYDIFIPSIMAGRRWSSRASACLARIETNAAATSYPKGKQFPVYREIASSLTPHNDINRNDFDNFLRRNG